MTRMNSRFSRSFLAVLILIAAFAVSGQGCQTTKYSAPERDYEADEQLRDSYRQYRQGF